VSSLVGQWAPFSKVLPPWVKLLVTLATMHGAQGVKMECQKVCLWRQIGSEKSSFFWFCW